MNNSPFNTEFEISLRVLLLLSIEDGISFNRICAIDFIATYGKDFNVSTMDLNGSSIYRAAEYANRKNLVNSAIKELVLKDLVKPQKSEKGFVYFISQRGNEVVSKFQSEYSEKYKNSCIKTKNLLSDGKTDIALEKLINSKARASSSI